MLLGLRFLVPISLVFLASTAQAQQFTDVAQQLDAAERVRALVRNAPMRVQINYQLQFPASHAGTVDEQKQAIASAHAAIFELAAHECDQIKAVFPGDCRLVSLNVNNASQPYNTANTMSAAGSASFELTPAAEPAPPPKP